MAVRIGIVGAGGIARSHATRLSSVDSAELAAVYDVDMARAAELASSYGACTASTLDELLDTCDALLVCTWTSAHREAVERAAARGRAVFCEKPLAATLVDARAMADAVETSGTVNQVGLSLRWRPAFGVLRKLLADPANGKILTAALHRDMPNRANFLSGWRGDAALAGGGILLEVGFHDVDLLEWLVAPVEAVGAVVHRGQRHGIEDGAALSLEFAGGGVGALVVVCHDAPFRRQSRSLRIVCEHAYYLIEIEGASCQLNVSGPGERQLVLSLDDLERMSAEFGLGVNAEAAFVSAVERRGTAAPNFRDAVRIHELVDAAYRSASRRGIVTAVGEP